MPSITLSDALPLYHDLQGTGDRALVIPGGPARHPSYLQDLGGITSDLQLIIPELRGVGRSPSPLDPSRGTWWAQAEDMARLIETQGAPLTVIAHSAGSRIAVVLASEHPELVDALILITPPPMLELDDDPADIISGRDDEAFLTALEHLAHHPDPGDELAYHNWQYTVAPTFYARWDEAAQQHSRLGRWYPTAVSQFFGPDPIDPREALQSLHTPTLILAGDKDISLTPSAARSLAAQLSHGEVILIEDCGHYPWVEQPIAFRNTVVTFLAEHRARQSLEELL